MIALFLSAKPRPFFRRQWRMAHGATPKKIMSRSIGISVRYRSVFSRVASRIGISIRYRSVFSQYVVNGYWRKTR